MNALTGSVRLPNRIFAALVALVLAITGCKSNKESAQAPPAAQGGAATAAITQTSWAPDALEELVAPIALYPDQLVGQILAASVSSQEVLDAGNWLLDHQDLKGDALTAAAKEADFGPAMQALVQFPTVVDMMCQELDWTKQLGAAFTSDQKGVLDAIQRLRTSALNVGNLKTGPQQTVETTTDNGQSVVEIKPTDPKVVYVPQYDPAVVYTTPPATSTTTVIQEDNNGSAAAGALLGFGLGIMMGAAINNSYCYPHYGYGAVYMGPRPFYPPAYAYRPVYPAYRPAYGYHPPGGYGNNYHRGNTNININNNYYNRFDNNANLKGGGSRSPLNDRGRNNDRGRDNAGVSDRSRAGNKAGVSDRAGASNRATASNRAGSSSGYKGARPGGSKEVRDAQSRVRDSNGTRKTAAAADRGYGGSDRASSRPSAGTADRAGGARTAAASQRPSASTRASTGGGGGARVASGTGGTRVESGGGANVIRSSGSSSRSSGSAFSGASRSGGGSFDRAASARGNASTSSSSARRASSGGGSRGGGGRR